MHPRPCPTAAVQHECMYSTRAWEEKRVAQWLWGEGGSHCAGVEGPGRSYINGCWLWAFPFVGARVLGPSELALNTPKAPFTRQHHRHICAAT